MERQQTETVQESKHSVTWTLSRFSQAMARPRGEKIVSVPFILGALTFEFWLYPEGLCAETEGFVGLMLDLIKPSRACIKYSLSIGYDHIKTFQTPVKRAIFTSGVVGMMSGDLKLAGHQSMLDQVLAYTNDNVMIRCTIYGLDTPETCRRIEALNNYGNLFDSQQWSDVVIVIRESVIHAHRLILMTGSRAFAAMLRDSPIENGKSVIHIDDVDYDVMVELVRFVYTRKISRSNVAMELLAAANKFALPELVTLCRGQLQTDFIYD